MLKELPHRLCILKNLAQTFQVGHLQSILIFATLYHPCSSLVSSFFFGVCLPWQTIIAFDVRRTHPNLGRPVVLRGLWNNIFRRSSSFSAPSWITSCVHAHLAFLIRHLSYAQDDRAPRGLLYLEWRTKLKVHMLGKCLLIFSIVWAIFFLRLS